MRKIALTIAVAIITFSCKPTDKEGVISEESKQATIDSMNVVMEQQKAELARQKSIDSMKVITAKQEERTKTVIVQSPGTTTTTVEKQRKGWSGAAKGAVIGAGVGAVTGAIIDKKKPAEGAVIGGLAGAGVGAGTGAILDAQKKKREAQK